MRTSLVVLLLLCWLSWNSNQANGQIPGPVLLKPQPKLGSGIGSEMDAFPRVAAGSSVSSQVAARINTSLGRFEAEAIRDARFCRKEQQQIHSTDSEGLSDWQRQVKVTMRGPQYLSIVAEDTYDCGAPHPLDNETALVYDLSTGFPVNWTRLLPSQAKGEILRTPHHLSIGVVYWPEMLQRAKNQADSECEQAYSDHDTNFNVWLEGSSGSLVFSPNLSSHLETALCSQQVELSVSEARKLGVAPELLTALEAAKKQ